MNNFSVFPVLQFFLLFFFMLYSFCTLPPGKPAKQIPPLGRGERGDGQVRKEKTKKVKTKNEGKKNEAITCKKREKEGGSL